MTEDHAEDVVRVATARNPAEAYLWRDALLDAGIAARVVGDILEGGFGGLNPTAPEVWVHRRDLEKARKILAAHPSSGIEKEEASE
ncbi:MAG: DUF2007 domain-containing protein [Gemmatales bacterium]|nr:DUF2007 domain-containing protein [Gemmatales bacterium]MDW8388002.1 DUF2007 domain-containing protein [Gemmatales bacterium]